MEYEKCYVYKPNEERPAKRRKTEAHGLHRSWPARRQLYQQAWSAKQALIDDGLANLNSQVVNEVCEYLDNAQEDDSVSQLPAAIVLSGPRSPHSVLMRHVSSRLKSSSDRIVVHVSPGSGVNLKMLLKHIIRVSVASSQDEESEEHVLPKSKQRFLNYDLQALQLHVEDNNTKQVIIAFDDTEGFDGDLLSDLVRQLSYWRDRIPFVLLLSVATSVDILQQHLTSKAKKVIKGRQFLASSSEQELQVVLDAILDGDNVVIVGASVMRMAVTRYGDYIQDIGSLVTSVQYAYMSCFFANPLSVFLAANNPKTLPKSLRDHIPALRMVPSFQTTVQQMVQDGRTAQARQLLENDQQMYSFAIDKITEGRQALSALGECLDLIRLIQRLLPSVKVISKPTLYLQALAGKIRGSAQIKSLFLAIRKAPAEAIKSMLDEWLEIGENAAKASYREELDQALQEMIDKEQSQAEAMMKNKKIKSDAAKDTSQDAEHARLIRQFADDIESQIEDLLVNPKELPFHEIFVYDLVSPLREVFAARPRYAVERALTAPHDYLGCDCCEPSAETAENGTLSNTQPTTSILYQLYLESGNLINAHDAWRAFQAILGEDEDEQKTIALFQRSLADLKHLGMVKGTRKRVDHVAKVSWKGL